MAKPLKKARIYLVIGGPSSGKETLCKKAEEEFGFIYVSSGDVLRNEIEKDTEVGRKVKKSLEMGMLVTAANVLQILKENMLKVDSDKGFLIAGFPRNSDQAASFDKEIGQARRVIHLKASEDALKSRCMSKAVKRIDDSEEAFAARLATYNMNIRRIINYYSKKKKLCEINAEQGIEELYLDFKSCLE